MSIKSTFSWPPRQKLRVWHIPQIPGKPFYVNIDTIFDAVKLMDVLADYDNFQYENNIKPDYCNMSGVHVWDDSLTEQDLIDMELDDKWVDWYVEDEAHGYFDDPREYTDLFLTFAEA